MLFIRGTIGFWWPEYLGITEKGVDMSGIIEKAREIVAANGFADKSKSSFDS